jgi:hypothetical protein
VIRSSPFSDAGPLLFKPAEEEMEEERDKRIKKCQKFEFNSSFLLSPMPGPYSLSLWKRIERMEKGGVGSTSKVGEMEL